ncbi:MAG: PilZ domain-containing protein [Desulfobacteraceae bacterium]|jgi:c-di-GMP-binding flagellar brake protein YcgR
MMTEIPSSPNDNLGMRLNLELGSQMYIRIEQFEQTFRGILVGAETGEYLIVKTAIPREFESAILPGLQFNITYQSQGTEYGFPTSVIDNLEQPYRLMFLTYPQKVDHLENRNRVRSYCYIPSSAQLNSNTIKGVITDISTSGCRFVIRLPVNLMPRQLLLIDSIVLNFPILGLKGVQAFQGKVRNTTVDREKIAMGVEFVDLDKPLRDSIMEYVDSVTEMNLIS